MALLDDVKNSLGITHSKKDSEITTVIEAAKIELERVGVGTIIDTDAATKTAVILFCRYWFNYQGEAERYHDNFQRKAAEMALNSRYGAPYYEE